MKIFKFGGASVKDVDSIKNIKNIICHEGVGQTLIVISAMGKMTNAFEKVVEDYYFKKNTLQKSLKFVKDFHQQILDGLFDNNHHIYNKVNELFGQLSGFLITNTSKDYNYIYDQIVSYGELLSTTIVSEYLNQQGVNNNWLDVRNFIHTDDNYRDAKVNWSATQKTISENVNPTELSVTQGFLGSYHDKTTTLGREGSDYTAAIFAYCLDAKSVTIWKDVDGVMNADPRKFSDTKLLTNISYTEAIEMAFYGASVIHPKTIQPIEQKHIPLYVRSFVDITQKGTCVSTGDSIKPLTPCYIVKNDQILISISAKDFSFMVEENISELFKELHQHKLKVNLIQNSAISFSVCVDDKYHQFDNFYKDLHQKFNIKSEKEVTLFTIRHYENKALDKIKNKGVVLLSQILTNTAQLIIKENF